MSFDTSAMLRYLGSELSTEGQLVDVHEFEARSAEIGKWPPWVSPPVKEALARNGIFDLYLHQEQAIDCIHLGENTVISTGTASGKSLCYTIPILESFHEDPDNRFLMLYPTKALAQDQLHAINRLTVPGLASGTYDGDTPGANRKWLRDNAHILLSNLDMLHASVLPNHRLFRLFLRRLKYVVIDEAHTLRGVFGSHAALLLRRFRRILNMYRADPVFILSSATLPDPDKFATELLGLPAVAIERDTSPRGARSFALWNPPMHEDDKRASSTGESARILTELVEKKIRTIAFSRTRRASELVASFSARSLQERGEGALSDKISPYRSGYLPHERREIEKRMRQDELLAISATSALELGIDIGSLDACIINGFPGAMISLWQQAGRAGRRQSRSLAVLVAGEDALDQYYMEHPGQFFSSRQERAVINPENPYIMDDHLRCAAYERPLLLSEGELFGQTFESRVQHLIATRQLALRNGRVFPMPEAAFAANDVSLRGSRGGVFSIVERETGSLVGTVDRGMAFYYIHPGAIYLHRGEDYVVEELRIDERIAIVTPSPGGFYTQVREDTDVEILEILESREVSAGVRRFFGRVRVSNTFLGYQRKASDGGELLSYEPLDLPRIELETESVWYVFSEDYFTGIVEGDDLPGTLHAFEHTGIALLPLFALCDRRDIGGMSTAAHSETGASTVFIYDGYEGGIGISRRAFERSAGHVAAIRDMLKNCPCKKGCPSCVQSPKCGNLNEPLSKSGALRLAEKLLGELTA